jgi:hypothetical protein
MVRRQRCEESRSKACENSVPGRVRCNIEFQYVITKVCLWLEREALVGSFL